MKKYTIFIFYIGLSLLFLSNCAPSIHPKVRKYNSMTVIDVHNHDAAGLRYEKSSKIWNYFGIDKIVLFGAISEPAAVKTDEQAWAAYLSDPQKYFPFFAGFDIHDPDSLEIIERNFEKGYFGIGEFVAASAYSPVTSKLPWKGNHATDGCFPEVYELCEKYRAPILLHIDPPDRYQMEKLGEALSGHPNTDIIFAHANAYNTPANIERLLQLHENIYIDFFAGFTAYNKESRFGLSDYAPLIEKYPGRFLISSDSGYGVGYEKAYSAVYELFELLDKNTVEQIAYKNFSRLMEKQPATKSQKKRIKKISENLGITVQMINLNKRQANEWLIENSNDS